MRLFRFSMPLLIVFVILFAETTFADISASTSNEFENGVEGWGEGGNSPNPPTWTANPGWNGEAGYLINQSSGGFGAGSRHLMWTDDSQWLGDYLAVGVESVNLWVDNRSGVGSDLDLRIAFNGDGGWFASDAQTISDTVSGNEWTRYSFDVDPGNFSWITGGTNDFTDTLTSVSRFEILLARNLPTLGGGGVLRGDSVDADIRLGILRYTAR